MAKKLAMVFGVVFVLVGLLGFISNPIVGSMGFFMTNHVHDLVHLLVGVVMLVMSAQGESMAIMSLTIFGAVYALIAVLGFVMTSPLLGLVAYNSADNWLHVVLAIVLLGAGLSIKKGFMTPPAAQV